MSSSGNIGDAQTPSSPDPDRGVIEDKLNQPTVISSGESAGTDFENRAGTVVGDRYVLESKLGEGGMGEVWVAAQTMPIRRSVAIKLIKAGMDSKAVISRFEQERQALAVMDHPNIARILDGGLTERNRPYFVMELVQGESLTTFCDANRLTTELRLELFVSICQAVQHAHQKGIVHRDLKPSNILVTIIDGRPVPKVIDFGLAKATSGGLSDTDAVTQFGMVMGTLEYMSPEQAAGANGEVDTRTDIYSLGVILYELLAGLKPFDVRRFRKAALDEMLRIVREEEPSKPSTRISREDQLPSIAALRQIEPKRLLALLHGELALVAMKCLAKEPHHRYETASGLARDIQRYLADEPVEARPPSFKYLAGKFFRRNKGPTVAAASVLLTLVVGVIGTAVALFEANKQTLRAESATGKETVQRIIAEKAEAETLADYRAATDDAILHLIGSKPQLGAEERKYLKSTLNRWQTFADRRGDDDRSRAIRAEGHARVAAIWVMLGELPEALREYQRAVGITADLVSIRPLLRDFGLQHAVLQRELGGLFRRLDKHSEAIESMTTGMALLEQLAAQHPGDNQIKFELAKSVGEWAADLAGQAEFESALVEFTKSDDLLTELVQQDSGNAPFHLTRATGKYNRGVMYKRMGRSEDARSSFLFSRNELLELLKSDPDSKTLQKQLADSHYGIADLALNSGLKDESVAEGKACRDLRLLHRDAYPSILEYQADLASSQNLLAIAYSRNGDSTAAALEYESCLASMKRLIEAAPDRPEYRYKLALVQNNCANVLPSGGDVSTQLGLYESASRELKQICESHPDIVDYRHERVASLNNMSILHAAMGNLTLANAEQDEAISVLRELSQKHKAIVAFRIELGGALCNRGVSMASAGDAVASLPVFEEAIAILRAVFDEFPDAVMANTFLIISLKGRSDAYVSLSRIAEALLDLDTILQTVASSDEDRLMARAFRLPLMARLGQWQQAIVEAMELERHPWDGEIWLGFARVFAIAAAQPGEDRQAHLDKAVSLVEKAVTAGNADLKDIAEHSDFAVLREIAKVRAILVPEKSLD